MKIKFGVIIIILIPALIPALPAGRSDPVPCPFQEEAAADETFSLEGGMFSLNVIRECLVSFRKLTVETAGKIPAAKLKDIGNTDWEMQTLGFANHPGIVEGALLRQDGLIKRLQWELIRLKVGSGAAGEEELKAAREALEASDKAFAEFKAKFRLKD